MLKARLADIFRALRHWPDLSGWRQAGLELCWALPLMLLAAYAGGLVRLQSPPEARAIAGLATILFITPTLGEELLFRGMLIPRAAPSPRAILISAFLFVLWHPLQAATIGPPWAKAFLDPWFLAAAAVLGLALGRIYAATRSLWPCVVAHWLVVFGWKAFLDGPF